MNVKHKGSTRKIPKKYVPDTLSASDKKKQVKSIVNKTARPKLDSAKTKRSSHAERFERKFGYKVTSARVTRELIRPEGKRQILAKGRAAYYTGGSRPNTTPTQWANARLAAVLSTNGAARKVDRAIYEKYKI